MHRVLNVSSSACSYWTWRYENADFVYICNFLTYAFPDKDVLQDLQHVVSDEDFTPKSPQEICGRILYTFYLGTENSSQETKLRAEGLAQTIGSSHRSVVIDVAVEAILKVFTSVTGFMKPRYKAHGGENRENLALQNIQVKRLGLKLWTQSRRMKSFLGSFADGFVILFRPTCSVDSATSGWTFSPGNFQRWRKVCVVIFPMIMSSKVFDTRTLFVD